MKTGRTWLVFSLIRLGIFAVVLAVLLITQMTPWIAACVAALISLCASYIFLRKPREVVAQSLYEARHGDAAPAKRAPERAGSDEQNEDAVVDRSDNDSQIVDRTRDSQVVDRTTDSQVVDRTTTER